MSEAQRRRELADRLDTEEGAYFFDAANEVIALLRSDAAALEAAGVEPVARIVETIYGDAEVQWRTKPRELPSNSNLYGPDIALRLAEALRQRDALAKALKQAESEVNTIVDDIAIWGNYVEDNTQKWNLEVTTRALANVSLGADAALKEVGHE